MEGDHIGQGRGFEILDAADARPLVRMHEIGRRRDRVVEAAIRRRQHALAIFLLDHRALGLEVALVDIEVGHALGLGPQQAFEVVRRHDLVVGRHVVGREGVVGAAHVLGQPSDGLGLHVARALEHQVLEEMREAGAPLRIVLRADVVPDLHADRRARMVFDGHHLQPVGQGALAERHGVQLQRRCGQRRHGQRSAEGTSQHARKKCHRHGS